MENMFEEYEKRTSLHANKRNDPPLIKEQIPVTTEEIPQLKTIKVVKYPTKKKKYKPIITGKDIEAARQGIKWAVKGYRGTAKQAYEERLAKRKLRLKNLEYEQKIKKLKSEDRAEKIQKIKGVGQQVKKVGRIKSVFNRNKSIYK